MCTFKSRLPGCLPSPPDALLCPFPAPLAEAGKFPLMDLFRAGRAQVLQDRGFAGSQDAAMPDVWFEAGARGHKEWECGTLAQACSASS